MCLFFTGYDIGLARTMHSLLVLAGVLGSTTSLYLQLFYGYNINAELTSLLLFYIVACYQHWPVVDQEEMMLKDALECLFFQYLLIAMIRHLV